MHSPFNYITCINKHYAFYIWLNTASIESAYFIFDCIISVDIYFAFPQLTNLCNHSLLSACLSCLLKNWIYLFWFRFQELFPLKSNNHLHSPLIFTFLLVEWKTFLKIHFHPLKEFIYIHFSVKHTILILLIRQRLSKKYVKWKWFRKSDLWKPGRLGFKYLWYQTLSIILK